MIDRRTMLGGSALVAGGLLFGGCSSRASAARFPVAKTDAEWRRQLGPERYHILREAGTERAGTSPLNEEHRRGTFVCAADDNPLFSSATKFDSGTGWPSFWKALPNAVVTRGARNLFFGTEILCARCGGHLGHVFNDGPKPTGLRYCMNGLALRFRAA
jgi:peptide-methionine (R)-S-oxide reductase